MFTQDYDISYYTPHQEICDIAEKHQCIAILIEKVGPAGGNPLYRFITNSLTNLQNLEDELFGPIS